MARAGNFGANNKAALVERLNGLTRGRTGKYVGIPKKKKRQQKNPTPSFMGQQKNQTKKKMNLVRNGESPKIS